MRLLLIDNYDSFTFNLFQLISSLGAECDVYRNDHLNLGDVRFLVGDAICISPGPKTPFESGVCPEIVRELSGEIPILGVCLGMQVINEVFSGNTIKAPHPVHGKTDNICHNGRGIFKGIPDTFKVARYHSLICDVISEELEVTAWTADNIPMAIQHKEHPCVGVQFHPESFLSEYGPELISNFLNMVKQWYSNE